MKVTRREVLALGASAACVGLLATWSPGADDERRAAAEIEKLAWPTPDPATRTAMADPRRPARLVISAIGLDEPVKALGLTTAGEIAPPPGVVQWFTGSVVPGAIGAAVLAAHVTSPEPDVFFRLGELAKGDTIEVTDADGVDRSFVVTRTAEVDKLDLTRDQSVWGKVAGPTLVLITCDTESGRRGAHLAGNVVVWAEPS